MSVPAAQLILTVISKPSLDHIAERHAPGGSGDALFDQNFLDANGGYSGIAKSVFETGASSMEFDNSHRLIYRYYKNFNAKTGIGKDKEGGNVVFKGVEMVGVLGTLIFNVETMFPKGILKT